MFSNIPINLLSETQLGGCTRYPVFWGGEGRRVGRRGWGGGAGSADICSNKEGNVCEPADCAHKPTNTHTHSATG